MNDDARPDATGLREDTCRWSDARQRWEVEIRPGVSKESCGHRGHSPAMVERALCTPDPTPELDAEDSNGERSSSGEPDAGDVDVSIKAQNPDLDTAWRTIAWWEQTCAYWHKQAHEGYSLRDSMPELTRSAREQGRAEGEAEWAAAVEEVTEHVSRSECWDDEGYRCPTCTTRRALLTADRTKALDAVKAQAAREALTEAATALNTEGLDFKVGGWGSNEVDQSAANMLVRTMDWLRDRADRDTDGGEES